MLKIDCHIHTIYSGDAFSTFYEVLEEAVRKNMHTVAITDHGPKASHAADPIIFYSGRNAPKNHKGVNILFGAEANFTGDKEGIDISVKIQKNLDIVLIGLHSDIFRQQSREKNTKNLIKTLKENRIHVFTHPFFLGADFDYEKVYQAACDANVLLEINTKYLKRLDQSKEISSDALKSMIAIAKKNKKMLIVNTDSHFLHEIGDDSILEKYKTSLGLTDDIIINNYPDKLMDFIKSK